MRHIMKPSHTITFSSLCYAPVSNAINISIPGAFGKVGIPCIVCAHSHGCRLPNPLLHDQAAKQNYSFLLNLGLHPRCGTSVTRVLYSACDER